MRLLNDLEQPSANTLEVVKYIGGLENEVANAGVNIKLRTDFGFLVRLCQELPGKAYPTAMFNPLHNDIGPDNGFWLWGTNESGETVHVQAARFDDYTGTNLAEEFRTLGAFYTDASVSAPPGEWCESDSRAAARVTGPVCYHGEMWLNGTVNRKIGRGLSRKLARMALALAMLQWKPNFSYGITWDRVVKSGFATDFGFSSVTPDAFTWERPYRDQPLTPWLMLLTSEEIRDFIENDQRKANDQRVELIG